VKKIVYALIAGLVAVGGSYFYQVHQINSALDDIGRQLSPVGRLDHRVIPPFLAALRIREPKRPLPLSSLG